MYVEAIFFSLIIGWIRGGKIRRFKNIINWTIWLLVLGVLLQYILTYLGKTEEMEVISKLLEYSKRIEIFSYILILIGILTNIRFRSFWPVLFGYLLNFIVLMANSWQRPNLLYNPITSETKLPFLGDIILFSEPYPLPKIISLGDLIIAFGIFSLIQEIMLGEDSIMGGYRL